MTRETTRIFSLGGLLCRGAALLVALVVSSNAYSSCASPANDIERENCRPGTPSEEWDIPARDHGDPTIQGFATDISVNRGSTVRFKVSTDATAWRLDIYRMGYYDGNGARLVATVNPSVQLPQVQPPCFTDSTTGLVDCGNWGVSASWTVPTNATSGIYFAKATRTDTGGSSHIVFIVRNDASKSDILFQVSDTSWQAYNTYSPNFYGCNANFQSSCRALKISYNRPFWTRSFEPETWVFGAEYPMVFWLEANGYDVTYFTDTDTDRFGSLLRNHRVFMSNGHDEYWSGAQRANVEAARAAGVHLAFFSANSIYWKVRWENSIDGSGTPYRTLVCYKETWEHATTDPDPSTWTGTWRDPRFSPPKDGGRPENELMGTWTRIASQHYRAITVPQADGRLRFWRNTQIANLGPGETYTLPDGTLGAEIQTDEDNGFRPAGLFRLSSTQVTVPNGYLLDYGNTTSPGTITHNLTMYRHSSGALVFSSGTYNWSWGLSSAHDMSQHGSETDVNMRQATVNLFADMGVQPRTLQAGLVPASISTDQTRPQSVVTSPSSGSSIPVGVPVTVVGTAADGGGGVVAGVEVSTDGGTTWHPANGRGSWTYTFTPNIAGTLALKTRAVDDSGNLESPPSNAALVTVTGTSYWTIWPANHTPSGILDAGPDAPVQMGVKFRANSSGYITGIRFYKASTNTGIHTGTLWTSAGVPLATATFTNESASGWQQVLFANPVAISADTVYVASYHTSVGHYSSDRQYFAGNGIDSGPLNVLGTTAGGSNGVYAYGASTVFPNASLDASNYWVDVLFTETAPPPPTLSSISVSPAGQTVPTGATLQLTALGTYSNLSTQNLSSQAAWNSSNSSVATVSSSGLVTALTPGSTTVSATLNGFTGNATLTVQLAPLSIGTPSLPGGLHHLAYSTAVAATGGIAPYTWTIIAGALPAGLSLNAGTGAISGTPTVLGNFTFTIRASDSSNPTRTTSKTLSINVVPPASSIWGISAVPSFLDAGAESPVELGVKFFSDASGYITGARFYKASTNTGSHVASLWTSTGTLLATATFTAETASGWQEVSFPAPVLIAANTVYVVSYHTNVGHYSFSPDYFAGRGADNPPLHFLADGIAGGNGVYSYGANSTFPTNTYRATNYWVDAVYSAVSPPTAPLTIATTSLRAVTGLAYSSPLEGLGGSLPYSWSLSAGALPAGLTLNPTTGAISGTPTEVGNSSFTVRISDSSNPVKVATQVLSITIGDPASSVWDGSTVPDTVDAGPDAPVELGVKFSSDMSGYITGARFFKASTNTGAHVANLWSSTGTLLATATFTAETASGWQQVSFPTPVAITANTVYVMSYHTDVGHYSYTPGYFSGRSAHNPPLRLLDSVYAYSASRAFPTSTYNSANYWVDVVFAATAPPPAALTVTTTTLPDGTATVPYSATLSGTGGTPPFAWSISSGTVPPGLSIDANTGAISGTPTALGTYNFTVRLSDSSGPAQAVTRSMSITIGSTITSTIWPDTAVPAVADAGPDGSVELGVRFRPDVNGRVAGIRFYKAAANVGTHTASLWSSTGTLLATTTFTNETASGWQQVNFPTPVAVTANTIYVASYHTDIGHYSYTPNYFGGIGVDNPPLHVPTGGGVYAYGPQSVFPSNSWNGSNYWVDIIFTRP